MGEGTSAAHLAGRQYRRGSDKDRGRRLPVIPPAVEGALVAVARRQGQLGLVVLLAKYYLRPEQVVTARVVEDGLLVERFERPIALDPADRELVGEWLGRRRRARSAQVVRDVLGRLRAGVIVELTTSPGRADGWPTAWADLVDVGIVSLRRLAAERHAESCGFEEAVYTERLHDAEADPHAVLRYLSRPARRAIGTAAGALVVEISGARERPEES